MGLAVLEQGLLLGPSMLGFLSWGGLFGHIVVQVPSGRGQVLIEPWGVDGVVAAGLVGGGHQDGG